MIQRVEGCEATGTARASFAEAALQQVRDDMFDLVSLLVGGLALLLLLLATDSYRPRTWLPALTLLGGVVAAGIANQRHRGLGSFLLSASLLLTTILASAVYPEVDVGGGLALAIMVIGVMLGPRYPVGIALALSGIAGLATLDSVQALAARSTLADAVDGVSLALATIAWGSAGVTWLITRPIRVALTWSWQAYVEAEARTHDLQLRQGELNQALRQLDDACYRLERANDELARARRAAEEARRLKAEFAATISHELRTPLNLIVGLSEMIVLGGARAADPTGWAEYRDDVEIIYRNACQIANLIDDVLDLSQIDAHRLALEKQEVRLIDLVGEVVAMVDSLFRRKGIELVVDVPADLPLLWIDPNRIRQVLINLLNNAARFTNEGGVTVQAWRQGSEVIVSVADTGIGIPAHDLPRVFQEFRQVGAALSHRYGGSGFGLYISKRFVELHGGTMSVESEEGVGTTFRFTLPLTPQVVSDVAPVGWDRLARTALAREITVGVLGSPRAVRVFQRYLDGYRVVDLSRANPAELRQCPPHAIVRAEPEPNGPARLPRLRPERSVPAAVDLLVLPTISCPLVELRPLVDEPPVVDYLVKPVSRDRLAAAIQRLGRPAQRVLVVDDDPDMARLIAQMVRGTGRRRRVSVVYDGAEALQALREKLPDVLLLDLLMPGVDGHAVLQEMRADERLRAIPTIVVSAPAQRDDGIRVGPVVVGRAGELSVGQAMQLVKAGLDLLFPAERPAPETDRAQSAAWLA